jgi:hypothetical protein
LIQRIQTLWLLLAAGASALMFRLPLWEYRRTENVEPARYLAPESLLLLALITLSVILAVGSVFLYKNRPLQKKICLLGLILAASILALEVIQVDALRKTLTPVSGLWQFGALMPVLMMVFFILAFIGIRKDEALIKSLDRLR